MIKTSKYAMDDMRDPEIASAMRAEESDKAGMERAKLRKRIVMEEGCETCAELASSSHWGPSHDPSPRCESGKRPHCTCDICF